MRRTAIVLFSVVAALALAAGCYHDDLSSQYDEVRCDPASGCVRCDGPTCYTYYCDTSHQCPAGYTCTASGTCGYVAGDGPAAEIICDATGCQSCELTELGRDCTAYLCSASKPCPGAYVCDNGTCRAGTGNDGDTVGGGDVCETECCANADCTEGYICSLAGACVERPAPPTPDCDAETPCPDGEVCEDGACVVPPPECVEDGDCAPGQACTDGSCVTRDFPTRPAERCVIKGDCGPDGTCVDGACHFPCDAETACPVTQNCKGGLCVAQTDSPEECVIGLDCGDDGARCIDGTCRPVCEADDDCADHERCDATRGLCEPDPRPVYQCLRNADCATGRDCVDGRCLLPCATGDDCGAGDACEQGWCVAQFTCFESSACEAGELCVNGSCETL